MLRTIGRYKILGELGRGAMGIVYRAQDPNIGREVAIKTIRLSELTDAADRAKLRDRLFREAQSAGVISHPGIVTIYDVAEEGEVAYIAMELVNGPTLERLMHTALPSAAVVLGILGQTGAALDHAHKRGIVHRDVKPANIMVDDQQRARITDFGVARILSHQMTQAGSMVGTPNYMSPEQIQGLPVDGRSDQFSLAVIAYELLTGEKPVAADSIAALAYRIAREQPAAVHRLNSTLDWPVDTVIQRALAKESSGRYATCVEFTTALENACRACKKWTPLAAGRANDMATVGGATAPRQAAPAPPKTPPPLPAPKPAAKPEEPRKPSAIGRFFKALAWMIVGVGIVAALIVGGLQYLENQRLQEEASATPPPSVAPEPVAVAPKKPSPVGEVQPEAEPKPEDAKTEDDKKQEGVPADAPTKVEPPKPQEEPAQQKPAPPVATKKPAVAATTTPKPAPTPARLVTNPPGAFLVVDGVSDLSCTSPCTLSLSPGRHTLSATMAGYRRTLRILDLPGDSEMFLNLERATGTVMVRSEPRGATITVDGQTRAERTPAMLTLPAGRHIIELSLQGQRELRQVDVRDSILGDISVSFGGVR